MTDDDFESPRPGEKIIELPPADDAGLIFIGRIRTPWSNRHDAPRNPMETEQVCTVELDPRFAEGLTSIETSSHLILLYWLDRARRDIIIQAPRHDDKVHGVFALRSPVRPNPIGLAVVDLLSIERNKLTIRHIDCLDGTPLLDIKPYFPHSDSKPGAEVGWHKKRARPLEPRGGGE